MIQFIEINILNKLQSTPLSTNRFGRCIESIVKDLANQPSDHVMKYKRFAKLDEQSNIPSCTAYGICQILFKWNTQRTTSFYKLSNERWNREGRFSIVQKFFNKTMLYTTV